MGAAWTHICCSPASIDFKCVEWSDITMDQPMLLLRPTKIGGGFVKEDVLAYVDELNSKIVALENELKEAQESAAVRDWISSRRRSMKMRSRVFARIWEQQTLHCGRRRRIWRIRLRMPVGIPAS